MSHLVNILYDITSIKQLERDHHGNKGRKPLHTSSHELKTTIITLYNNKYWDATFSYACELMAKHDSISISPPALANILYSEHILSPRTTTSFTKSLPLMVFRLCLPSTRCRTGVSDFTTTPPNRNATGRHQHT